MDVGGENCSMETIIWIFVALLAVVGIGFFAYMAYRDEKEIDDDLRKAEGLNSPV